MPAWGRQGKIAPALRATCQWSAMPASPDCWSQDNLCPGVAPRHSMRVHALTDTRSKSIEGMWGRVREAAGMPDVWLTDLRHLI